MADLPPAPSVKGAGATLAEVAVSADVIERNGLRRHPAENRMGDDFKARFGAQFPSLEASLRVRLHRLRDVVLDVDSMVLLQDGVPVRDTAFHLRPGQTDAPVLRAERLVRLDPGRDYIIGLNNASGSYLNWMMQCVPAIDWSLRQGGDGNPVLLLPPLTDWQAESLVLLNTWHLPTVILQPGRQYWLPQARYADFLNNTAIFGAVYSRIETARRLATAVPRLADAPRVLHVPHPAPYYGHITNAAEARSLLESRGVRMIDPARHDVAARIALFRQADAVIGPMGGLLADVMFCRPGAVLWEWMPPKPFNQAVNFIARSANLGYWGDVLLEDGSKDGGLLYDLGRLASGVDELLSRPPPSVAPSVPPAAQPVALSQPLGALMLAFESLGDNCEFGMLQRHFGEEPLGLLRLAAFNVPPRPRPAKLAAALRRRFEGLGDPGTIRHWLVDQPFPREIMVEEGMYGLQSHSGVREDQIAPDAIAEREARRLRFLHDKFLRDLSAGEKIWVWKSTDGGSLDDVQPVMEALRALGPNKLLWAVDADESLGAGMVERLGHDLIRGALAADPFHCRVPPPDADRSLWDARRISWVQICEAAYAAFRGDPVPA